MGPGPRCRSRTLPASLSSRFMFELLRAIYGTDVNTLSSGSDACALFPGKLMLYSVVLWFLSPLPSGRRLLVIFPVGLSFIPSFFGFPLTAPFRVGCLRALPGGLTVISFTGSPVTVIPSFTGSPVPAPFRRRWLAYSSRAGCPLFGRSPGPLSPLPFPRRSFPFPYQLQRTEEFGIGRSRVAVEIFLVHRMVRSKFPAFLRVVGVK